jgi:two-component system nitrogen regulation sensor histidine kinase GlnL
MTADPITFKSTPDLAFMSQHLFTAILLVNDDLSIIWLNAQAEQLLAISRARLLNQSILALLAPEESPLKNANIIDSDSLNDGDINAQTAKEKIANGDKTCTLTERFNQAKQYQQPFIDHDHMINPQLNGGAMLSIDYSVTPVIYQQQAYFIIEMWGKDRQSRISEEEQRQRQHSVARHMLRSVAHEIKNPLAGIRGAAQLLQRQFVKFGDLAMPTSSTVIASSNTDQNFQATVKKLRTYTDIIISETDRLTQLIGQLLGSNQLPKWQMMNIHEPIEHVLTLVLSQYPKVALERDYDLSLPELCADEDQLIQVFLNLINNACESMTEFEQTPQQHELLESNDLQTTRSPIDRDYQAQLHIQTRVVFQHTIGSQQHKKALKITLTDNGSGIDPLLIGQIFFPMVTSRAAGTGLGLAIVQDIINRHHGMIDVSSVRGQTHFTVYLPFSQPAPAA